MASIEEIIARLQGAGQKVAESVQLLNAAETTASQLQAQMAAAGVMDKVAKFAAVKDSIARTRQHLLGGSELINQSMNHAKAAGG